MATVGQSYDLVVIGCGAAGLACALSAAESASRMVSEDFTIAVLERAPREKRGGNTRWTGAYMRLKDENAVADRFVEDWLEFSKGLSDERYARVLAEKAPETIRWLQSKGVEFDRLKTIFLSGPSQRIMPVGAVLRFWRTWRGTSRKSACIFCTKPPRSDWSWRKTAPWLVSKYAILTDVCGD